MAIMALVVSSKCFIEEAISLIVSRKERLKENEIISLTSLQLTFPSSHLGFGPTLSVRQLLFKMGFKRNEKESEQT
jgi:hypothetical protein